MIKITRLLSLLILIICFSSSNSFAQGSRLKLDRDTVPATIAKDSKKEFRKLYKKKEEIVSRMIKFDVLQLKELLDSLASKKVDTVVFQIASITISDTARYNNKHKSLTSDERKMVLNQPTLLIRVPTLSLMGLASLKAASSRSSSGGNAIDKKELLNIALLNPYYFARFTYIEIGSICPPPQTCDSDDLPDGP